MGGEAGGVVTEELAVAPATAAVAALATMVVAAETAVALGREVASGEPELEEEIEETGDGGKNSGNAFFSIRCTVSSLNHDDRTGTVHPGVPAAAEEALDEDAADRARARVGDVVRDEALTGEAARRGVLSVSFSSFSLCLASLRRSDEMVCAACVEG